MGRGRRKLAALVAALAVVLLAACGSEGDSPTATEQPDKTAAKRLSEPGPLRISGGGIGQFREPGADNTIEEYGPEGTRAELEQAARTVHEYLVALVEEDWEAACSYMSKPLRREYEGARCPTALTEVQVGPMADTPYEASEVDAGSILVKGNYGFLFFNAHTNGRKLIIFREQGLWRPYGLTPTSLH